MKTNKISFKQIFCIGIIFLGASFAWMVLGGALSTRTGEACLTSKAGITQQWGPSQGQAHPVAWYLSPTGKLGKKYIQPSASDIQVKLHFDPKKKGLHWNRTYEAEFVATYTIPNTTPIDQTVYVSLTLPSEKSSYTNFSFSLGEDNTQGQTPRDGSIQQAATIPAGEDITLKIAYKSRGIDSWIYELNDIERVSDFHLRMETDFTDYNFPMGTSSPTTRKAGLEKDSWEFYWHYPDVINPQHIGMDMPNVLNPGPIAARISFFAPVSLLFFFAVILIIGAVKKMSLHPMNYFFLAAGFFAFQILFVYLVDLLPIHLAFLIASVVSLVLVGGYIIAVGGRALAKIALPAQFAYLILFSYSFFFDGLSGLTITIGAIVTLGLLMIYTAKLDWSDVFKGKKEAKNSPPTSVLRQAPTEPPSFSPPEIKS